MASFQTPVGTLSYPHVFKARAMPGSEDKKFSAVLLFSPTALKTPAWQNLSRAVEELAKQSFPKLILGRSLRSPFRLVADRQDSFPKGYEIFITASTTSRPGVVDAQRQDILDSADVWPGQHARFSVNPFSYDVQGNKGISLGLQHVQIVKSQGLERLDGRKSAQDSFDAEFDEGDDDEP
jgi:hypothetical protein